MEPYNLAAKKISISPLFMILAGLCLDSLRSRFRRNLSWELNIVEKLAANQRLPEPSRRLSENPVKNYVTISPLKLCFNTDSSTLSILAASSSNLVAKLSILAAKISILAAIL